MGNCYHCGQSIETERVDFDEKTFCCTGCKTVYEILNVNNLENFYAINDRPGIRPDDKINRQFTFLDAPEIREKVVDFSDDGVTVVQFHIPVIHCTSCVWLLESLPTINSNVISSTVNFPKKNIQITFKDDLKLSELAKLITSLGYKPAINLKSIEKTTDKYNRSLITKLAVAGFCFGNIMLIAFPEYVNDNETWLENNKDYFRWFMFILSLPVVFYSATDYFISAWQGLKNKFINVDVPIAIGIVVLFLRSTYDIIFDLSPGYFDTLAGLLFFMLIGKWFQQQTYQSMAFDRDYKSFYPIAIAKLVEGNEEPILLSDLKKGDRIRIRNEEIIPADAILMKGEGMIDNSFVTGESRLIPKNPGDKIFAGGKQSGQAIELEVLNDINQSYLTQLWNNDAFQKSESRLNALTNKISHHFTLIILIITILAGLFWYFYDSTQVLQVVTSILIIACPCALALSSPFILGNMMRIFGEKRFYIKNTSTIENLAQVDTVIFDKTGTITESESHAIEYEGVQLTPQQESMIKAVLLNSNHPLSRMVFKQVKVSGNNDVVLDSYEEIPGKGQKAVISDNKILIGSRSFVGLEKDSGINKTEVYIKINDKILGRYIFNNIYRKSLNNVLGTLKKFNLGVLSGDNESEKEAIHKIFPAETEVLFNQTPADKLDYIKQKQSEGHKVLMVGDGLNDAGALKQSDVGISISEDINSFSPSCDGILDYRSFASLGLFLKLSKKSMLLVKIAFLISFLYNVIGVSIAIIGKMEPVIAAILMPISSISVVLFATFSTRIASYFSVWNLE